MYQSLSFDSDRERRAFPSYPRSNRGLVLVTKPSRKQNLFFGNEFIIFLQDNRETDRYCLGKMEDASDFCFSFKNAARTTVP